MTRPLLIFCWGCAGFAAAAVIYLFVLTVWINVAAVKLQHAEEERMRTAAVRAGRDPDRFLQDIRDAYNGASR